MDIIKKEEYIEFAEWMAIPPALRQFKDQRSLASHLGLHESTLSDWKKLDSFWAEVEQRRFFWGKCKTNEVIYAFYNKIIKNPTASDVRLWLEYFENFRPHKPNKVVIVDNNTREQTEKLDAILNKIMIGTNT